jgi:hypothetical protein
MRTHDWLLLLGAFVAVLVGVLLNGPICDQNFGPSGAAGCAGLRFPFAIAGGTALAIALLVSFVIRWRARGRDEG